MSNCNEHASESDLALLIREEVSEGKALNRVLTEDVFNHRVPQELDLWVRMGTVPHDL